MIRFLFKWSLELTGASIILFNYQQYDRQQQLIGMYRAARNSIRTAYHVAGLAQDFKKLVTTSITSPQYLQQAQQFRQKSAQTFERLCQLNQGVYARMGQLISKMTGVLPESVLTPLQKLNDLTVPEMPYESVKQALTEGLQKPMKEVFDGFQTKPFSTNLFWQQHKSILLENYKESLVKVMPPSTLYQSQYDFWFINKCLKLVSDYIQKNQPQALPHYEKVEQIIRQAEEVTSNELDLKRQYEAAQKLGSLIYEPGSSFYIPYYYQKYSNKSVIIRQFIEGVSLADSKGLKQMGISVEIAFAHIMSELHRMMNRYGMISGALDPSNILIRKYVKPAKRKTEQEPVAPEASQKKKANIVAKGRQLLHPQYQIVFLNLSNMQSIPQKARETIQNYWLSLKKTKRAATTPSISSFYKHIPDLNNLKENPRNLLQQKYYLYEPMLNIYEQYVGRKENQGVKGK